MATGTIKISELDALSLLSDADEFAVVDKSDTSEAASGTTKKVTKQVIFETLATGTYTFVNKTIDADDNTISNISFGQVNAGLLTGGYEKASPTGGDLLLIYDGASGVLAHTDIGSLPSAPAIATGTLRVLEDGGFIVEAREMDFVGNLDVALSGTRATISTLGEANQGSQLGAGANVYKQMNGVFLEFRSILTSDNTLSATENANDIDLAVDESNLAIANMSDYDANKYVDHTLVDINVTGGLSGGGTIDGDVSIAMAIDELPGLAGSGIDDTADKLAIYDADAAAHKEIAPEDLLERLEYNLVIAYQDNSTALAVEDGVGDWYFTVPEKYDGWYVKQVEGSLGVAPTGTTVDLDFYNVTDSVDILSTGISIESGETSSYTAATRSVVNQSNNVLAKGDQLRLDCNVADGKGVTAILTVGKHQIS